MIGARVTQTANYPGKHSARWGTITAESKNGKAWYVLWDGRTSVEMVAKSYVHIPPTKSWQTQKEEREY